MTYAVCAEPGSKLPRRTISGSRSGAIDGPSIISLRRTPPSRPRQREELPNDTRDTSPHQLYGKSPQSIVQGTQKKMTTTTTTSPAANEGSPQSPNPLFSEEETSRQLTPTRSNLPHHSTRQRAPPRPSQFYEEQPHQPMVCSGPGAQEQPHPPASPSVAPVAPYK